MFDFLVMHAGSIGVGAVLLICASLAVWHLARERKKGRSVGCGCDCSKCGHCSHNMPSTSGRTNG